MDIYFVEHVCKNSGPISLNGVDVWTFVRKTGVFTYLLEITWFQCRFDLLRQVPLNIQHRQVRSSRVCAKLSHHGLRNTRIPLLNVMGPTTADSSRSNIVLALEDQSRNAVTQCQMHIHERCNALTSCYFCLLYTSPSPRDQRGSRMPSSA